jgi:lipopolysaccharide/colanic/teichoic acid biosynthesis glycosyltransferase
VSLIIALAVKLEDRGPIFYTQDRLGSAARRFRIWKFRSMVPDADRFLTGDGRVEDTPRVTRVGRILRQTGLDELPQLINILRGEMSIIGPRPVLPSHWDRYTEKQRGRFAMRPGITGLAQVNGRNTLSWSKRIEADLEYIEGYSLYRDLVILLRTFKVVLFREGFVMDRNP